MSDRDYEEDAVDGMTLIIAGAVVLAAVALSILVSLWDFAK